MTIEQIIIDGNKVVAKYMGISIDEYDDHEFYYNKDLQYNSDWNLIMPVVQKINSTHKNAIAGRDLLYTLSYLLSGGYWKNNTKKLPHLSMSCESVWLRCVEYIKTYNT